MNKYPFIKIGLILCAMRGDNNHNENLETLKVLEQTFGEVVCAFDIAGAEAIFPTENFKELFEKVKSTNIPYTIHAGEAAGPESVWSAIELGAHRIGHGVRAVEDEKLVDYLAKNKIPLEVCITSNIQTKIVEKLKDHPVKYLYDKGVIITLNSDNMTVSNTNIQQERKIAKEIFGFTEEDLEKIDNWAVKYSFL